MTRDLNEIECFVKGVELKSLTAAAKALKLPKSNVSRKIKNLEERVGMTLLTRTTRASHLTEAGRLYFEKAAMALKELNAAEEILDGTREQVEGLLRITAPSEFSSGPVNEMIASFMQEYPRIRVELLYTDYVVDLIGQGFDFAFRVGALKDSTLVAKRVGVLVPQIVASPAYLKKHGT